MGQRLRLTHRTVDAAAPVATKQKKADPYTMNQERPYDPADASKGRSYDYVPSGTPDWLEWELPRQVPELGPKEPRNEEGWPEFKDEGAPFGPMKGRGAASVKAPVALVGKAAKCLRVAQVLLPNLPVAKLESFATALMNAQNELIDEAYTNAEKLSVAVAESKSSESSSTSASVKKAEEVVAEEKKAVESASSESSSTSTKTAMGETMSSESSSSSTGLPGMESKSTSMAPAPASPMPSMAPSAPMASTTAAESTTQPEPEVAVAVEENSDITFGPVSDDPLQLVAEAEPGMMEGVSPAPSDDLFSMLFTEAQPSTEPTVPDIGQSATAKTASTKKVGIAKLASGPKVSSNSQDPKYLEKLWDSAPDVSNIF